MLASCSTKKNTSMTRFWHAFTARYNIYYNGTVAYIDGSLEKEKGNKDNYTEILPLYTVGNKASRDLGKANYEIAIKKAQKAIQLHSIKRKPEWNKDRKKTEKDIEWLNRKEYNPFLWRAWMLMGRSQFYEGKFDEAAATFSYMARLFKGQPGIYGKARAWLAKCYTENEWYYEAEDVIHNQERDSIDWRAQKEWDYTYADYYLRTGKYDKAAEYLHRVIKHEMRAKQRAREYYILGQIEAAQGHKTEAYKAFKKSIHQNPPYELEFNARIAMTEVMAGGQAKKMISRLKRIARNDNNKDYLDQVYYAIGNIYLAEKDTTNAIGAYEKGNQKATRSGIEKGVLLLHLGDLYWAKEKYSDAKRVYGEAIGLLDKDRKDYEQLSNRSKLLDELVPYTDAIHLQDSLLELSVMPEKERNQAIDRVIKALKDKEKEEEAKKVEAEREKREANNPLANKYAQNEPTIPSTTSTLGGNNGETIWYFYSPTAVQQGKQTFIRTWGKRDNVDDWQRGNKTVVGSMGTDEEEEFLTDEQRDSVMQARAKQEAEEARKDSAVNDPHKREYYMAQIPFSEEAKAEANKIIEESLVKAGEVFQDKLENLTLAEKEFQRLLTDYPNHEPKDEIYYRMYLINYRQNKPDVADEYLAKLKTDYPKSTWTTILTDPLYRENAIYGTHIEDSIYGATYDAFKADRFQEVYRNNEYTANRFPLGANRDRFTFLYGLTKLNDGDQAACVKSMKEVVEKYPKSPVAEMAGMIVNGVQAGKRLHGAKFDLTNVWNRRSNVMAETDSLTKRNFTKDRNVEFDFVWAYNPEQVNENQLLFQMARYNFTSFVVRNFDLNIEDNQGMHQLIVSGFRNYDEARQYANLVFKQEGIMKVAAKARPIIIAQQDLDLLGGIYSYNDYEKFYNKNFAPLPVRHTAQLYEPDHVAPKEKDIHTILPTEEVNPKGIKPADEEEEEQEALDGLVPLPTEEVIEIPAPAEPTTAPAEEEIIIPTPAPTAPAEEEIVVPVPTPTAPTEEVIEVPAPAVPEQTEEEIIVPIQEEKPAEQEGFEIIDTTPSQPQETEQYEIIETPKDAEQEQQYEIITDDAKDKKSINDIQDEYFELDGF